MTDPNRRLRFRAAASILATGLCLGAFAMGPGSAGPAADIASFSRSGIEGSDPLASMQSITVPARVARVAVVPGSPEGETWAMGRSSAHFPGWASKSPEGQLVFLRFTRSTGWRLVGPPVDPSGRPFNVGVSEFALSASGEGWAVGERGTLIHKPAGSQTWTKHAASDESFGQLLSVSLVDAGGRVFGFAGGKDSLLLRYDGVSWARESPTAEMVADGTPGFIGVTALGPEESWVVSDDAPSASGRSSLRIYRRSAAGWSKILVGQPFFDGPFPAVAANGSYNQEAIGTSIASKGGTVLIGGRMLPSDVAVLAQTEPTPDDTRPFIVKIKSDGSQITTYCPNRYRLRQSGSGDIASTTPLCDESLPLGAADIPSISMVSGDEAFAGGLGLLHFKGGGWFREPNTAGYVVSIAMHSPREGWVANSGGVFRGTNMRASLNSVGRWGPREKPAVARWSQTQKQVLEAVAVSPDGSAAIAVGQRSSAITFTRQLGWDKALPPGPIVAFHAAAWPGSAPWVVGDRGLIYQFKDGRWSEHPDSQNVTRRTLFGLAFRSASDGIAVGAAGMVLRYDGRRWLPEEKVTDATLYAATATKDGYVAVGERGTVIRKTGGSWARVDVDPLLSRQDSPLPHLYAAATLPSGVAVIGGQGGTLLRSDGGAFVQMDPPLEGTVVALAGARSGSDRLLASVSPDVRKFDGSNAQILRGSVVQLEDGRWKDISKNRRVTAFKSGEGGTDSSSFDDPVLGLATIDGRTGWAAGGSPPGIQDPELHMRSDPTGSIYRIDTAKDADPPFAQATPRFPAGVNFAVFGESWCDKGLCGAAVGTGTMADTVSLKIREEINRAASLPNGPKFVLYAGSMRQSGIPEELGQFKHYLKGFHIPVFAALGSRDLFSGVPSLLSNTADQTVGSGSNHHWKQVFKDMQAPWGTHDEPPGIDGYPALGAEAVARTHYAFDVLHEGRKALRVIVLDSSTRSLGNARDQNPPEPQSGWFTTVASEAKALGIPTVVLMNQPTVIPDTIQAGNWQGQGIAEAGPFETNAQLAGVTAIFSGGLRMNTTDMLPNRVGNVPLYVVGGGGAPLGFDPVADVKPTKLPTDGFYHAWHMATVNPDPGLRNLYGQAPLGLLTFPTLDSLAMHSVDGESVPAGNTMRFSALGRAPNGGWSDPDQSKAAYLFMGADAPEPCRSFGQGGTYCASPNAIKPQYRFYSENPKIADFVVPNFGLGGRVPKYDFITGKMLMDMTGQYGLLCTFDKGDVAINVESGSFRRRMVISVLPGQGPCRIGAVPPDQLLPERRIPSLLSAAESAAEPGRMLPRPPPPLDIIGVVLPPAPGPIAAPAPPASAATSRKDEEEHQTQSEGQEGDDAEARAMVHVRARQTQPLPGWPLVGGAILMGFLGAAGTAMVTRGRRAEPSYVELRIR